MIQRSLITFSLVFLLLSGLVLPVSLYAEEPATTGDEILNRAKTAAGDTGAGYKVEGGPTLSEYIGSIISTALLVIGSVFLALMVYGGYLWMTAMGNSDRVEKAKNIIITAAIGVVIVFTAYTVTYFIVANVKTISTLSTT